MSTEKLPAVTVVPAMVKVPVTALVRPTAVLDWPNRVSLIRYPASDPLVTFHWPSTETVAPAAALGALVPVATVVEVAVLESFRGAGALPSMKWM